MASLCTPTELTNKLIADEIVLTTETHELQSDGSTQEIKQTELKCIEEDTVIENEAPSKIICEPCLFDELETVAVAFCVICVEYLCTDCTRDHRRSKVTRQHKLLSDVKMPKSSAVFKMMKELTSCPDHPDMVASYECNDHNKFICSTCVAVNHRKCESVTEVSKSVTSEGECTEPLLEERLRQLIEKTEVVRKSKEGNISALLLDQTNTEIQRNKLKDKIALHIKNLCEQSESETEALISKEIESIMNDIDSCKAIETEEKQKQELLQTALMHGNTVERSIVSNRILNYLQRYEKETELQNAKDNIRLFFTENAGFLNQSPLCCISTKSDTKQDSLDNVAKIQIKHSSDTFDEETNAVDTPQPSKTNDPECQADTLVVNRSVMQREIGRTVTRYDTEVHNDSRMCTIKSVLILSDGRIAIIDEYNKKLKILGADFTVQLIHDLGHGPIDMCEVSENTLAVVFQSFQRVKRYSIRGENILDDGGFSTKLYALSIATFNSKHSTVAVLFSDEQLKTEKNTNNDTIEVQVRNSKNGQIMFTLSNFKTKQLKQMTMSNPVRIYVVGKEKKRILIPADNILHCFEIEGSTLKEEWFYLSHENVVVDTITDVTADSEDNVYIACIKSHNIHQISSTNFRTNRVVSSKCGRPFSLCIDKTGTQILVGCGYGAYLDVYQFV